MTVLRHRGERPLLEDAVLKFVVATGLVAETGEVLLVGTHDEPAVHRVHGHDRPRIELIDDVVDAHDRRDFQRAGRDGGVRGRRALVGHDGGHLAVVKLSSVGRAEVVGDDHRAWRRLDLVRVRPQQRPEDPLRQERHVELTRREIFILDGCEALLDEV